MKLNDKQQRFVDEYLIDLNATRAAIRAGYSEKTASSQGIRLLRNARVSEAISKRLDEKEKALIAEQDEILATITGIIRGEVKGTALVGVGHGAQEVEDVPPTVTERLRAAELLGKYYKVWTDKQQVDVIVPQFIEDVPKDDD